MTTVMTAITGFHQDEHGDWVAELACGHTQHVRHRPPWEIRAWVVTQEGRQAHLGARLACPACLMPALPKDVVEYKRTETFDEHSVPKGLLARHSLKAGTWGELVVLEGQVRYIMELEASPSPVIVLHAGLSAVIAPESYHHIEVVSGARFYVRFLRASYGVFANANRRVEG